MRKVALVTYGKQPKLFDGDNLLVDPFKKYGFKPLSIPWDKKRVAWEDFDLVILRSTWDYHLRVKEFLNWLEYLEDRKVKLWNPPNIIRWNINKKYLLDLEKEEYPIIPTVLIKKESIKDTRKIAADNKWEEIIIKPTIGNSAYNTYRLRLKDIDSALPQLAKKLQNNDLIIQPYIKEINQEGEYSFIFFNKKYSHTVLKVPKKNEFRSQREFGGKELKIEPNQKVISQAERVLDKISSPILYARIDGLVIEGQLKLMELELIEPYLFFEKEKNSAEKFVKAAISFIY